MLQLVREAQKVTKDRNDGVAVEASPWLRRIEEKREFYRAISDNFEKYFDLYGEDDEE